MNVSLTPENEHDEIRLKWRGQIERGWHQAQRGQVLADRRSACGRSPTIWLVSCMEFDLRYFDDETCRLEPIQNPFGPKVLPMCPE
jgi:hypothetical protein